MSAKTGIIVTGSRGRLVWLLLYASCLSCKAADKYISMGVGDVLLGQPEVQIEVYRPDDPATTGTNEYVSYGPETVFEMFFHRFLLDTGANGLLLSRDPFADENEESNLQQMAAKGFVTNAGAYREQGVAGYTDYGVSGACDVRYAGASGTGTITGARFMCNDVQVLGDFSGIMGMPAMTGRVILADMGAFLDAEAGQMRTHILDDIPGGAGPRFHVALEMTHFPQSGQINPGDPLPSWAPLPFVTAYAAASNKSGTGRFLLDTGAQLSMISCGLAFKLGLDSNGDGELDDGDERYGGSQDIGGVGGTVSVPMFNIDVLSVATAEGVDLQWNSCDKTLIDETTWQPYVTNVPLTVLVLDISDEIDGVLGMDVWMTGWSDAAMGSGGTGAIMRAYFDFRGIDQHDGELVLDLADTWNTVVEDAARDTDADGMPDGWECARFGSMTNASAGAESDYDHDGFRDLHEYLAGTDPTNAVSRLAVSDVKPASSQDQLVLSWAGVTGKTYRVTYKTNLLDAAWSMACEDIAGAVPCTTATVDVSTASAFVRVELQ